MKSYYVAMVSTALAACGSDHNDTSLKASTASRTKTVKTSVTCEQSDGDQWLSVGVARTGSEQTAYVVKHNDDDSSSKLILKKTVHIVWACFEPVNYADSTGNFKLIVSKQAHPDRLVGSLSITGEGTSDTSLSGLECFKNSTIKYEIQ